MAEGHPISWTVLRQRQYGDDEDEVEQGDDDDDGDYLYACKVLMTRGKTPTIQYWMQQKAAAKKRKL